MPKVFLSHNSSDKAAIRQIQEGLTKRGVTSWLDEVDIPRGAEWIPRLEAGLGECDCCAIFYGPHGVGPWHNLERQLAQQMAAEAWRKGRKFGIIPVRLPGAPAWVNLDLPPFPELYSVVDFERSISEAGLDLLEMGIRDESPPPPAELDEDAPPYVGMRPLTEKDTGVFTGRNNYIIDLFRKLMRPEGARFLSVLGASGSGKSSLLHAGLLPRLKMGRLDHGTREWLYVTLRPGNDPLLNLEAALGGQELLRPFVPPATKTPAQRKANWPKEKLHGIATSALGNDHGSKRLIIVVDQFEELLTLRLPAESGTGKKRQSEYMDEVLGEPFLANLRFAAEEESGTVTVIIASRSDFHAYLAHDERMGEFLASAGQRCVVSSLAPNEVRAAIERPAMARGVTPDEGLVETVVQDYQLDPVGALPFLQEAMSRVWEKGRRKELTLAAYREFGGLRGALNAHADQVYQEIAMKHPAEAELFPPLFIYLTRLSDDGRPDTKRRRPLADLPGGEASQALALKLASKDYRLLVLDEATLAPHKPDERASPAAGVPRHEVATVEIAHESLLTGWMKLHEWLNDPRRPDRQRLRRIESEANSWEKDGKPPELLLADPELRKAEKLRTDFLSESPGCLTEFLEQSREALRRRRRFLISSSAVVFIIAAAFAVKYFVMPLFPTPEVIPPKEKAAKEPVGNEGTNISYSEIVGYSTESGQTDITRFPAPQSVVIEYQKIVGLDIDIRDSHVWEKLARDYLANRDQPSCGNSLDLWEKMIPADLPVIDDLRGDLAAVSGDTGAAIAAWTRAADSLSPGPAATAMEKIARQQANEGNWQAAGQWATKSLALKDTRERHLLRFEAYKQMAMWKNAQDERTDLVQNGTAADETNLLTLPTSGEIELMGQADQQLLRVPAPLQEELAGIYLHRAGLRIRAGALAAAKDDLDQAEKNLEEENLADKNHLEDLQDKLKIQTEFKSPTTTTNQRQPRLRVIPPQAPE